MTLQDQTITCENCKTDKHVSLDQKIETVQNEYWFCDKCGWHKEVDKEKVLAKGWALIVPDSKRVIFLDSKIWKKSMAENYNERHYGNICKVARVKVIEDEK